jgi:predicted secreted protein
MTWVTGIVTYFLIWWTALFAVLPWGVQHDTAHGTGAPVHPHLKRKFLATTILSALVWLVVALLMHMHLIDFRAISMGMIAEDTR